MNRLVGERLSIITASANYPPSGIGIVNSGISGGLFTYPGVPSITSCRSMLKFSLSALGVPMVLYVTDVVEKVDKSDEFLEKVQQLELPVLLLINKIDLTDQEVGGW